MLQLCFQSELYEKGHRFQNSHQTGSMVPLVELKLTGLQRVRRIFQWLKVSSWKYASNFWDKQMNPKLATNRFWFRYTLLDIALLSFCNITSYGFSAFHSYTKLYVSISSLACSIHSVSWEKRSHYLSCSVPNEIGMNLLEQLWDPSFRTSLPITKMWKFDIQIM